MGMGMGMGMGWMGENTVYTLYIVVESVRYIDTVVCCRKHILYSFYWLVGWLIGWLVGWLFFWGLFCCETVKTVKR